MNKILVGIIALSVLAVAVGLALVYSPGTSETGGELLGWGLWIGQLSSQVLLLVNGKIFRTGYFRVVLACLGVTLVGVLFKIEHWAAADVLLLGSLAGVMLTYLLWFSSKKPKRRLDMLKLAWVLLTCAVAAGVVEHWLPRDFTYLPNLLLLLTVGEFIMTDFTASRSAVAK